MKKVMLIVLALFVAPAMAGVTIEVVPTGPLTADIVYAVDGDQADGLGGSLVAGLAIEVAVDAGIIEGVTAAKTGVSELGDEGYGIFMSTIIIVDGEITDAGSPVAIGAPDYPGQPGTDASCVLEFGALWDQRPPEAEKTPPLTSGVLCTITVTEACTMTIGGNATRGKAVMIGGAAIADADIAYIAGDIDGGGRVYGGPDQAAWIALGKPDSWANPRQCHGDADEADEQIDKGTYYVGYADINILLAGFKQEYAGDPVAQDWIAADFDHGEEVIDKGTYRVGYADINILLGSFKQDVVPADCNQ